MKAVPKILLVEDDEDDYLIVCELLRTEFGDALRLDWTQHYDDALRVIGEDAHDVYLIDCILGANDGLDLVRDATARNASAAMVVLTGHGRGGVDVAALSAGASDYLEKTGLSAPLLARSIRHAMERKKFDKHLTRLAHEDSLTGIANRAGLLAHLESDLIHCKRTGEKLAVLLVDLDRFKAVNDTFGHEAGDIVLAEMAKRLQGAVRESDVVGRLGGDEFAVVATHLVTGQDVTTVVDRVVEALRRPVDLSGQEVLMSGSVGIAVYPDDATDTAQLLRHADLALYTVKEQGRNSYQFFDPRINAVAQRRREMEELLRQAISRDAFFLELEPLLDMHTESVTGVKALARWRIDGDAVMQAERFSGVAEATGLGVALGERLLGMACRAGAQWMRAGLPPIRLGVTVSPSQLRHPQFVGALSVLLHETGFDAKHLELDIAESVLSDVAVNANHVLVALRDLGVRLAIENYGAGCSCLAQLKRSRIDTLKFDGAFAQNADLESAAIARAIIGLGRVLEIDIVAQGVQTRAQAAYLLQNGCRLACGPLYGAAFDATRFEAFWRARLAAGVRANNQVRQTSQADPAERTLSASAGLGSHAPPKPKQRWSG